MNGLTSRWNDWTLQEKLMQLANYMRCRTEAKWNLLVLYIMKQVTIKTVVLNTCNQTTCVSHSIYSM